MRIGVISDTHGLLRPRRWRRWKAVSESSMREISASPPYWRRCERLRRWMRFAETSITATGHKGYPSIWSWTITAFGSTFCMI